MMALPRLSNDDITRLRPAKNPVDPWRPYAFHAEPEHGRDGEVADVATIFLTNRECPLRCLMCDLWKNTLDEPTPAGAVPTQIDYALERLPAGARDIKLYNSGNFFDRLAIPPADHAAIAARLQSFRAVIVENHPRWCGDDCLRFRDRIPEAAFEIALGLETAHPGVLQRLNKQMTLDDFSRAAKFLRRAGIYVRAFILLRPPGLDELEGVDWALRSLEFAFDAGADVCSLIPTRGGNGALEQLAAQGRFAPPRLQSLERVLDTALPWRRGRVFADLWEVERLAGGDCCRAARIQRLQQLNLTQQPLPAVDCGCAG